MAKIAGIICEYNPFHNGHLLQIDKLRQEKGAEAVVCAMSGCFMQRGEPAVVGKERRTMMALACGADLVVELPAIYATRSAHWFALGGVSLLAAAGATHLAFGAETDALPDMRATAERLANPDAAYQDGLRRFLSAGLPFAEAQTKALNDGDRHSFVPILPNDRLALSYLRVIAEKRLPLEPVLIPREGSGYLETVLSGAGSAPASATAIRRKLEESLHDTQGQPRHPAHIPPPYCCAGQHDAASPPDAARGDDARCSAGLSIERLKAIGVAGHLPEAALPYLADTRLIFSSDAAPLQLALLRRASLESLQALPDMTEGLEYRVQRAAGRAESLDEFFYLMKTRRYTMTRLRRMALHLLIDYREAHAAHLKDGPPYLRVLGANAAGRKLLHTIRKTVPIPIITRASQMKALARRSGHAANAWEVELRAAAMYSLLTGSDFSKGNPEYFITSIMV